MSSSSDKQRCEHQDLVGPYALAALERSETELMEAHMPTCLDCQREYRAMSSVMDTLSAWRTQPLPSSSSLWDRLVERLF